MRTPNLRMLFTLLVTISMMYSCSDDDAESLITPRALPQPDTSLAINLDIGLALDAVAETLTCGEGWYFYEHSGDGNTEVIGDFSLDLTYCGTPRNAILSEIDVVITDQNGDQIYLQRNNDEGDSTVRSGNNNTANSRTLVLDVTGGTGAYQNYTGTLVSYLPDNFHAGITAITLTFSGNLQAPSS